MKQKPVQGEKFLDRLRRFPASALAGALASFAAAARQPQSEAHADPKSPAVPAAVGSTAPKPETPAPLLEQEYELRMVLLGPGAKRSLSRSLAGIAVDSSDRIYVLGDGKVHVFASAGDLIRTWGAPEGTTCIAVDRENRVYFGSAGKVEVYTATGNRVGEFPVGENGKNASITAIKVSVREVLVADASARYIRRYDRNGTQLGEIGTQNKTRGFMLPNRALDIALDSNGLVRATDSGRHRVSSWTLDGKPAGNFGKFGLAKPEDFVGCCNPVNIAIGPDGRIVTAEKVAARVKVYDASGKLLGLIGPEHFDPGFVHLHLAVDSLGRILVGDPMRREVKAFSATVHAGGATRV